MHIAELEKAGIKVIVGPDYIQIARCGTHTKDSHNRDVPRDGNIVLKFSCMHV